MAGHMQQRGDNSWRLHTFIGLDSGGRRRYASNTVHGTKRQAEVALAASAIKIEGDRYPAAVEAMTEI